MSARNKSLPESLSGGTGGRSGGYGLPRKTGRRTDLTARTDGAAGIRTENATRSTRVNGRASLGTPRAQHTHEQEAETMRLATGLACALLLAAAVSATAAPTLLLESSESDVDVGEHFTVTARVDSEVGGLMGFSLAVDYDSALLEVVDVAEGELPGGPGDDPSFFYWTSSDPGPAPLLIDGAALGRSVDGPGDLAVITFAAVATGTANISFSRADLRDSFNAPITVDQVGCSVDIWPGVPVDAVSWSFVKSLYR